MASRSRRHAILRASWMGALALAVGGMASCTLDFDPARLEQQCSAKGLVTRARVLVLPEALGCDASPARCLAVVRPHLFFGTQRGLSAVDIENEGAPVALDFAPADPALPWVVRGVASSGRNVYLAAAPEGEANAPEGATLPILVASLTAPGAKGAVPSADARDVFQSPTTRAVSVHAAPVDGAFLVTAGSVTQVTRPASSGPAVVLVNRWPGAVASSGSRVVGRDGSNYVLLSNAGRPNAQSRGYDVPEVEEGEDFGDLAQHAGGPNGAVVSAVPITSVVPDSGGKKQIHAVRVVWLLKDDRDDTVTASERFTLTTYDPPIPAKDLDGPLASVAIVDASRALVVVPDPADRTKSKAVVVTRATNPPSAVPGLEAGLPYRASRVFPVSDRGVVYTVALRGGAEVEVLTMGASCTP